MVSTCQMLRRHFLSRAHNPGAAKEERLYIQQRSGPDDVRNGSIRANSFVLAVFSGLLVVQDENS